MNQQPFHKNLQVIIQWAENLGSPKSLLEPESQPLNPLSVTRELHEIMRIGVRFIIN